MRKSRNSLNGFSRSIVTAFCITLCHNTIMTQVQNFAQVHFQNLQRLCPKAITNLIQQPAP